MDSKFIVLIFYVILFSSSVSYGFKIRGNHLQLACDLILNSDKNPNEIIDFLVDEITDEAVDLNNKFKMAQEVRTFFTNLLLKEHTTASETKSNIKHNRPGIGTILSSVLQEMTSLSGLSHAGNISNILNLPQLISQPQKESKINELMDCMTSLPYFSWLAAEKEALSLVSSERRANDDCRARFQDLNIQTRPRLLRIKQKICQDIDFPQQLETTSADQVRDLRVTLAYHRQRLMSQYLVEQKNENIRSRAKAAKSCHPERSDRKKGPFLKKSDFDYTCQLYIRSKNSEMAIEGLIESLVSQHIPDRHIQYITEVLQQASDQLFSSNFRTTEVMVRSPNPNSGFLVLPSVNCPIPTTGETKSSALFSIDKPKQETQEDLLLLKKLSRDLASICKQLEIPGRIDVTDTFQVNELLLNAAILRNLIIMDFLSEFKE